MKFTSLSNKYLEFPCLLSSLGGMETENPNRSGRKELILRGRHRQESLSFRGPVERQEPLSDPGLEPIRAVTDRSLELSQHWCIEDDRISTHQVWGEPVTRDLQTNSTFWRTVG